MIRIVNDNPDEKEKLKKWPSLDIILPGDLTSSEWRTGRMSQCPKALRGPARWSLLMSLKMGKIDEQDNDDKEVILQCFC